MMEMGTGGVLVGFQLLLSLVFFGIEFCSG